MGPSTVIIGKFSRKRIEITILVAMEKGSSGQSLWHFRCWDSGPMQLQQKANWQRVQSTCKHPFDLLTNVEHLGHFLTLAKHSGVFKAALFLNLVLRHGLPSCQLVWHSKQLSVWQSSQVTFFNLRPTGFSTAFEQSGLEHQIRLGTWFTLWASLNFSS